LRQENPDTVVVSAGDLIGASPLPSALFHDEPSIEVMELIGLDINAVGNHEFDEGVDELLRMKNGGCHPVDGCDLPDPFDGADFTFLAANVKYKADGQPIFAPYEVRVIDGVPVAFIGMTLEGTPAIVTPSGITTVDFFDEVETVNALVPELQAQGVETFVVLLHEGGSAGGGSNGCSNPSGPIVAIANGFDDAVDVVVSGHTHRAYNCVIDGKIVTGASSFGRVVTDIDLTIDRATGDVVSQSATNIDVDRAASVSEVSSYVASVVALAAPLSNRELGRITATVSRSAGSNGLSPLGVLIADAQLAATSSPSLGGAQVAFMNPGGVRADLSFTASGSEPQNGIVTYGEAFAVQPFGNSLVVMTLTGQQLDDLLEQQFTAGFTLQPSSNFSYTYSAGAPNGAKVDLASVRIDGAPVGPADSVRVVANSFIASGGDNFTVFTLGTDVLGGAVDLEAFEAYFAANSPIAPPGTGHVTRAP
jgi:5'-nucleotidase